MKESILKSQIQVAILQLKKQKTLDKSSASSIVKMLRRIEQNTDDGQLQDQIRIFIKRVSKGSYPTFSIVGALQMALHQG